MKIAMMTNNYKPFVGGVPISIERLTNSLRKMGNDVTIFAPSYENQIEEEGVIRYKSLKKTMKNKAVIPYLFDKEIERRFVEKEIDVIHVHHPNFVGWTALYLGKKYKVPVVYTYHTRYEQYVHHMPVFNKLSELSKGSSEGVCKHIANKVMGFMQESVIPRAVSHFANKCDAVIAPTTLMQEVLKDMGVESPIEILPTGLNESFFVPNKDKSEEIRQKYKGNKKYLFCTVARLDAEKNMMFLIRGLERLKQELGDQFNTIIIGDGPQKEALQMQVKQLQLEEQVIFVNSVPNEEIKDYYSACDLFLFASKSETQGIVLLEAMAVKLPVVAVEASGVVEVVKNGVNGYMTSESVSEWTSGVLKVLNNPKHFEQLKDGAYKTAKLYTSDKVANQAHFSYQHVICKNRCEASRHQDRVQQEVYNEECYYEEVYTR